MEYLGNPIDVKLFDKCFREVRGLGPEVIFIAFDQTARRWKATYQDEEMSLTFEGDMLAAREWLEEEGAEDASSASEG